MKRWAAVLSAAALMLGMMTVDASAGDVCWRFSIPPSGTNPFPTDTVKVPKLITRDGTIVGPIISGSWVQCVGGSCSSATGPLSNPNPVLVPMVGTIQTDLSGNEHLMLDGRIVNTSLSSPFIFECTIDVTLDPGTLNSIAGKAGQVYAYCRNYFEPNNPFTDPLNLTQIPCTGILNP